MNTNIIIKQLPIGMMANFVYFVGDNNSKEIVVVDPAWDAEFIYKEAESLSYKITGLILTHTHYDHANAVEGLINKIDVPLYVSEKEAASFNALGNKLIKTKDSYELKLGAITIKFIATPGHTPGSQCLVADNNLITGDTLFINGCGRTDLPGSSTEEMYKSLVKIKALSDDLIVWPGHDYGNKTNDTLGNQKRINPYLNAVDQKEFFMRRMG